MQHQHETIVIGGGISGLACAHALGDEADVCLLEGSNRVGGLVHTVQVDAPVALRYEDGPEALSTSAEIEQLATELGLKLVEPPAKNRFLVHRGELVPVPMAPPKLLGSKLLSVRGKLRLLSEPWRKAGPGVDGSVADFVRERVGGEALDALVDPLVSGIHAGDPEQLSARACFPRLVQMVEEHGSLVAGMRASRKSGRRSRPGLAKPEGGMQGLADAFERKLGDRLRLGAKVAGLRAVDGKWALDTSEGHLEADRVILAVPLRASRRLLEGAAPDAAQALAGMQCESLVSLLAAYRREDVAHDLDGFGYLVPSREGLRHLGTLFSSSIDPSSCAPGHVLVRVLLGGARQPELVDEDEGVLGRILRDEVHPLLGIAQEPAWWGVERYREVLPRFGLDHPACLARFESALPEGLTVLGNFTHGIGLAALVERARAAARRIAQEGSRTPAFAQPSEPQRAVPASS